MGGVMNNHLQQLIERAYFLCVKLNRYEVLGDLTTMNEITLTGLIIGLERLVYVGGAL